MVKYQLLNLKTMPKKFYSMKFLKILKFLCVQICIIFDFKHHCIYKKTSLYIYQLLNINY
jgi:hypothetical protein